jgi:hypothetical protein
MLCEHSLHFSSTKWPVIKLFFFLQPQKRDDFAARVYRHFLHSSTFHFSHLTVTHSLTQNLSFAANKNKKCRFTCFNLRAWAHQSHHLKSRKEMKLKAQPRHHNRHFFFYFFHASNMQLSRVKHKLLCWEVDQVFLKSHHHFFVIRDIFWCYNQFIVAFTRLLIV